MNHYPAFLRPHGKSSNSNNENDENSSIKNLIFKHLSKAQQAASNNANSNKGTMRGILGEVGNMSLSNKPMASMITKPKIIQQATATIIETKSVAIAPSLPPASSSSSIIPMIIHKIEEINLNSEKEKNFDDRVEQSMTKLTNVPSEFDCDSGDSHNITTASEYVVDICKYWRELEHRTPIRPNFLLNRNEGNIDRWSWFSNLFLKI